MQTYITKWLAVTLYFTTGLYSVFCILYLGGAVANGFLLARWVNLLVWVWIAASALLIAAGIATIFLPRAAALPAFLAATLLILWFGREIIAGIYDMIDPRSSLNYPIYFFWVLAPGLLSACCVWMTFKMRRVSRRVDV
jgi:hypothetical protein